MMASLRILDITSDVTSLPSLDDQKAFLLKFIAEKLEGI